MAVMRCFRSARVNRSRLPHPLAQSYMEIPSRNTRFIDRTIVIGAAVGAVATALVWTLLQAIVGFTTISAHHGRTADLTSAKVVGSYVGSLFIAGICAGVFGGMASCILRRPGGRLKASLQGGLGAALLCAACAITYLLWGWPPIAEHVEVWAIPLILCGAGGGFLGSLISPDSPPAESNEANLL